MLTFRDVVVIAAVVALVLWAFRRKRGGCGCAKPADKPGGQQLAPAARKSCGLVPCGGGGR